MPFTDHDLAFFGLTALAAFIGARLAPGGKSDAARMACVEQKLDALLAHFGASPADSPATAAFGGPSPALNPAPENVAALVRQGHKIEAIKVYREQNPGVGLKEAKDAVDCIEQTLR